MQINGAIITDCADNNARSRQELRFTELFGSKPTFLGVGADVVLGEGNKAADVEAAGNLLDLLDAINLPDNLKSTRQTVILVNVAPRGGKTKEIWENGTPFCYFRVNGTLVVSTYARRCLSLIRDLGQLESVELLDVPTVTAAAVKWGELTQERAEHINDTQFRSFEFVPLVARWLCDGRPVPSIRQSLEDIPAIDPSVWCVDSFGNVKTTLRPQDINFEEEKTVELAEGDKVICYTRLADVPRGVSALVIGSSGYGSDRFLEVVVQRGNASKQHKLTIGSPVLDTSKIRQSQAKNLASVAG
jgi:hypothetical protein